MDLSMLKGNSPQAQVELVRMLFAEINTAIPGQVDFFNAENQTATVSPCIRGTQVDGQGNKSFFDLPQIQNCPVIFPYSTGTGFALTYPVQKGDQCLIIFSQRSFDAWQQSGGKQNPQESDVPRTHAYSDAICIVGLIPNVDKISGFQTNGIEQRNKDRSTFVKVSENAVDITGKQAANITGNQTVNITATPTNNGVINESFKIKNTIGEIVTETFVSKVETAENITKTVAGTDVLTAATITRTGAMQLMGTIATAGNGGTPELGLSTSVKINNITLRFINGLLVEIS